MNITFLNNDGRCKWLDNKVLKGLYPQVMKEAQDPQAKKKYLIVDWISSDNGKVGVDLNWFKTLGVPAVQNYKDLPKKGDFAVINTGYDSIVNEERILREEGVEIIDKPCPFIRRLRDYFEQADDNFQYIFLCEPNHITIKNFRSIFPKDMILVQMDNYQQQIKKSSIGKPFKMIPYVTFLPKHVSEIMEFIHQEFPDKLHESVNAHCLWVKSKASPIEEINSIDESKTQNFDAALLITGSAINNKSNQSLSETLEDLKIPVITISSIEGFKTYEKNHPEANILLVRSPIPNNTENEINAYIKSGMRGVWQHRLLKNRLIISYAVGGYNRLIYFINWLKYKVRFPKVSSLG